MPGDPEPDLWQRLLRWWQDRQVDQRAGEGSNSVDWLEEEDDAGATGGPAPTRTATVVMVVTAAEMAAATEAAPRATAGAVQLT